MTMVSMITDFRDHLMFRMFKPPRFLKFINSVNCVSSVKVINYIIFAGSQNSREHNLTCQAEG